MVKFIVDPDHTHKWRASGTWNGKTAEGRPTGGQMYKCTICNLLADTRAKVEEYGGDIEENTDLMGRALED